MSCYCSECNQRRDSQLPDAELGSELDRAEYAAANIQEKLEASENMRNQANDLRVLEVETYSKRVLGLLEQLERADQRIVDLDKKLNQAIDMLDSGERACLLAEWAK